MQVGLLCQTIKRKSKIGLIPLSRPFKNELIFKILVVIDVRSSSEIESSMISLVESSITIEIV